MTNQFTKIDAAPSFTMEELEDMCSTVYTEDTDVKIKFSGLTENQKIWFKRLLSKAIDDSTSAARNEHLWSLGTTTKEIVDMHRQNEKECNDYVTLLNKILEAIED